MNVRIVYYFYVGTAGPDLDRYRNDLEDLCANGEANEPRSPDTVVASPLAASRPMSLER
jgi:hypothetical protein